MTIDPIQAVAEHDNMLGRSYAKGQLSAYRHALKLAQCCAGQSAYVLTLKATIEAVEEALKAPLLKDPEALVHGE